MKIGVMDSGMGGITTLAALMRTCGGEYVYARDALGPYGDKDDGFVLRRAFRVCSALKSLGAEAIVLACNTATNAAIERLRAADPTTTYIGVEPAVRPALRECGTVAVALTPAAARQKKFLALTSGYGDRIRLITDQGLAPAIERSGLRGEQLKVLSLGLLDACDGCDGLVLGCTHYVFLKEHIRIFAPHMRIYDGNDGVARRALGLFGKLGPTSVDFVTVD